MPTVMNPHTISTRNKLVKSAPQKVCIGLGIIFVVIGLAGVMMPGFMGMHLSMVHNLIHLGSGFLALWSGYSSRNKAYNFCLGFGALYGLLGIAGFLIGEPGYPAVGHMEADQNLFRLIPNILELGTMDHVIHLLLSAIFLFTAFAHRKDRVADTRVDRSTPESVHDVNRRSTLGTSDVRSEIERKL
jgi:hypothetical protein